MRKIFYFHLIKKIIINLSLLLVLLALNSCYLNKVSNELTIKVTKVGNVKPSSNFIFIYPNATNLSLRYKSILNKISEQLSYFNFHEVKDVKQAKYAIVVILDNNFCSYQYNKESNNNLILNKDIKLPIKFPDEISKQYNKLILEVYLIKDKNNYLKVMEGYTIKTNKNITISEKYDKGYLGFVMCSIDALFSESIENNNSDYQEYYYKCY